MIDADEEQNQLFLKEARLLMANFKYNVKQLGVY